MMIVGYLMIFPLKASYFGWIIGYYHVFPFKKQVSKGLKEVLEGLSVLHTLLYGAQQVLPAPRGHQADAVVRAHVRRAPYELLLLLHRVGDLGAPSSLFDSRFAPNMWPFPLASLVSKRLRAFLFKSQVGQVHRDGAKGEVVLLQRGRGRGLPEAREPRLRPAQGRPARRPSLGPWRHRHGSEPWC